MGVCGAGKAGGIREAPSSLVWDLEKEEWWEGNLVFHMASPALSMGPTSGQVPWVWFTVMIMLVMMKREFSSCRVDKEQSRVMSPSEELSKERHPLNNFFQTVYLCIRWREREEDLSTDSDAKWLQWPGLAQATIWSPELHPGSPSWISLGLSAAFPGFLAGSSAGSVAPGIRTYHNPVL